MNEMVGEDREISRVRLCKGRVIEGEHDGVVERAQHRNERAVELKWTRRHRVVFVRNRHATFLTDGYSLYLLELI